jgi:alpha-galactosidase
MSDFTPKARGRIFGGAFLLAGVSLTLAAAARAGDPPACWKFADRPSMGWNSWDCFGTTITEDQTKAEADVMAKTLKSHGWEYVVVDIQWYEGATKTARQVHNYFGNPYLTGRERYAGVAQDSMDEFGRFIPAPNRFPSSANGAGFKALADYVHGLGLKFGVHMLRGIPRAAVAANTPIKGTAYHAADIADPNNLCRWNPDMDGVDMTKPGAQEYYNSVFSLLASWGVDFVKVDDISAPKYQQPEIEAIRHAIDQTGRPMVLSLSPGATPLDAGANVQNNANLWRISDDFWDTWKDARGGGLFPQFKRFADWTPFRGPGHFPDGDMLPLGIVNVTQPTKFTRDEQTTLMTLWGIARSPLIFGGDLTKLDDYTLTLITNDEILAVDQNSTNNHELFNHGNLIAWVAGVPDSPDKYLAVFNAQDAPAVATTGSATTLPVPVNLADLGFTGVVRVRDLWLKKDLPPAQGAFAPLVNFHGAALYRLSPMATPAAQTGAK